MSTTRRSSVEGAPMTTNCPLFFVTLPTADKSQKIFKPRSLCHISIRVGEQKAQNGLTKSYNNQNFGHVWANCKQPPRCLWCGGGHLQKGFPEKGKETSKSACCNCKLADGEKYHPSNYRGYCHAKYEARNRKSRRTPKTTKGRGFSSNYTLPLGES
jgi:hypothetical protein